MRFGLGGVASGLNCTMPKGVVAPGNTLPPLAVPINGLTSAARSAFGLWAWPADRPSRKATEACNNAQDLPTDPMSMLRGCCSSKA